MESWQLAADADERAAALDAVAARAAAPRGGQHLRSERALLARLAAAAAEELRARRAEATAGWDPDGTRWLRGPCARLAARRRDHVASGGCCDPFDHTRLIAARIAWNVEIALSTPAEARERAVDTYGDADAAARFPRRVAEWEAELDAELAAQLRRRPVTLARFVRGPHSRATVRDKVAQYGTATVELPHGLGTVEVLECPAVVGEEFERGGWVRLGDAGCDTAAVLDLAAALWADRGTGGDLSAETQFDRHATAAAALLDAPDGGRSG